MFNLNKLISAGVLALSTQGCADNCDLVSSKENSPQLASAPDVTAFCAQNKAAALECLVVSETDDKMDCSAQGYQCNSAGLQQDMDKLFSSGGGEFCVEGPAKLQVDF